MLEGLYVQVTLHGCRRGLPPEQPGRSAGVSHRCVDPTPFESSSWDDVDGMCLERVYSRFRVLQSCPYHLRGRFRKACRQVLESRHEGVQARDDVKETRSWKMFCLLPFMLLRRPAGQGRVGKAELCRRFDQFSEAMTYFGHDLLWPRPCFATTFFGQADFGHGLSDFGDNLKMADLGRFWSGQTDLGQL